MDTQQTPDAQWTPAQQGNTAPRVESSPEHEPGMACTIPFELLLAHLSEGAAVTQGDIICYVNPAVARLTGHAEETLLAQPLSKLIHPDDWALASEYYQAIACGDTGRKAVTFHLVRAKGPAVCVQARARLVYWEQRPVMVHSFLDSNECAPSKKDIHSCELSKVNERLAIANLALEEERAYFSSAIDLLPVPLRLVSSTHRVVRMNKAFLQFLKQQGLRISHKLTLLDPETHTPLRHEAYPEYRALHGEVVPYCEAVLKTPREVEIPVIEHAAPIYIGGNIAAAVVAFQDITALKEIDRAKDDFLAVLSHELITPLTSMLGWTEIAREATAPESMRHALEVVARNARRQQRILDDLLDVSRIIHQKLRIRREETDLWRLVLQSIESLQQTAAERQIIIQCFPPNQPLPVHADSVRIMQVICNLLTNAMKFTEPGGRITVEGGRSAGHATLAVHDTGCGIPAEAIHDIFKPFLQIQRNEANGGLGLGLALTKGIIELHNGQIDAFSPGIGLGSTFTIELPLLTQG